MALQAHLLSIACGLAWIIYMAVENRWYEVFHRGWPMTLTAAAGSFVAGSTPLGNGAISFPVLVLVLNVVSQNARTFAMMIQSVGMSCASYRILLLQRDALCSRTLLWMCLTGAVGFNVGYYLVLLPDVYVKTVYFSLTLALGVLVQSYVNKMHHIERTKLVGVPCCLWHFIPASILGGVLMSQVGTGYDVVLYIYLRFLYNTDELVATNHTIISQAALSAFGFYNAWVIGGIPIPELIWVYWLAAVPVVIVFAPLGNWVINQWKQREKLNYYIFALEIFQFIAGFVITISKRVPLIAIACSIVGGTCLALCLDYAVRRRPRTECSLPCA